MICTYRRNSSWPCVFVKVNRENTSTDLLRSNRSLQPFAASRALTHLEKLVWEALGVGRGQLHVRVVATLVERFGIEPFPDFSAK